MVLALGEMCACDILGMCLEQGSSIWCQPRISFHLMLHFLCTTLDERKSFDVCSSVSICGSISKLLCCDVFAFEDENGYGARFQNLMSTLYISPPWCYDSFTQHQMKESPSILVLVWIPFPFSNCFWNGALSLNSQPRSTAVMVKLVLASLYVYEL